MHVYVFLKRIALFIHVFAFYLFTSRSKASHLAMTHHTLFYLQFDSPKKSRQLHEVKESPSNDDDNLFCGENFGIFAMESFISCSSISPL
jgi:hypothetical protein